METSAISPSFQRLQQGEVMKKGSRELRRAGRLAVAALAAIAIAACTEDNLTSPTTSGPGKGAAPAEDLKLIALLSCTANRVELTVSCEQPSFEGSGEKEVSFNLILGGQGTFVKITTTNAAYNSGTGRFTFDMTVQNLIEQALGTTDGSTLDPKGVRVFFTYGPTVTGGTGFVAPVPDGFDTFTAPAQPFYQYDEVLSQNEVSPSKEWLLIISPTVTSFSFGLLVAAEVENPSGYISISPAPDPLAPGATRQLVGTVKNANGTVDPGAAPLMWNTSDPGMATVDGTGLVTGVRAGMVTITVMENGGAGRMGATTFLVTGTQRTWNGSVSSDWQVAGNWTGPSVAIPAPPDTVIIPDVATQPVLTQNVTIANVNVADLATLSLGAFNFTVTQALATGATGGSGVLSTTGSLVLSGAPTTYVGRVPQTLITGTASAVTGTVIHVAPVQIDSGLLLIESVLVEISSQ
jgi:hypothetical protein